jgi:glycosyltransferase involved in cell wall biosynthesis
VIVYDTHFNSNEWFVLIALVVGYTVVFLLPRQFPPKHAIVYGLYGMFSGFLCDNTLSVSPFNLYDVNDNSSLGVMDFLLYLVYAPFGYMFMYLYDRLKITPAWIPVYILAWSLFAIGIEYVTVQLGVFHYNKNYKLDYSFPIYLFFQSAQMVLYYAIQSSTRRNNAV